VFVKHSVSVLREGHFYGVSEHLFNQPGVKKQLRHVTEEGD